MNYSWGFGFWGRTPAHLRRRHREDVPSIGGYLLGLGVICFTNATLTTTFLAIVGLPFFLPLGILSGLSSLVPYAGPVVVGTTVTLIAFATDGPGTGFAAGHLLRRLRAAGGTAWRR